MSEVFATEERNEIPSDHSRAIHVEPGIRVFRVSDALIAGSLLDWSEPVLLKLDKRDDGTYELRARAVSAGGETT